MRWSPRRKGTRTDGRYLCRKMRRRVVGVGEVYGGETGIRTLDTFRYTRFPSVRLQPLGHLSALLPTGNFTTLPRLDLLRFSPKFEQGEPDSTLTARTLCPITHILYSHRR